MPPRMAASIFPTHVERRKSQGFHIMEIATNDQVTFPNEILNKKFRFSQQGCHGPIHQGPTTSTSIFIFGWMPQKT
ncbi:hypothetical protein M2351_008733 [Azospirillum canadense]|nr:hypothetical protein [Azospirillum canadense]